MTWIKICGLTRPQDAVVVNQVRPDFVGFVFAPDSRRRLTVEQAVELRAAIDPAVASVGVFRDAAAESIAELFERGVIGWAQLHGQESAAFIVRLRLLAPVPVIKAVSVRDLASVTWPPAVLDRPAARPAQLGDSPADSPTDPTPPPTDPAFPADCLLFDHGPGGTGRSFDLGLIDQARALGRLPRRPFFIAGGVGLDNLADVLRRRPDGVDVSSGAETDRRKDPEKIRRLVDLVRAEPAGDGVTARAESPGDSVTG